MVSSFFLGKGISLAGKGLSKAGHIAKATKIGGKVGQVLKGMSQSKIASLLKSLGVSAIDGVKYVGSVGKTVFLKAGGKTVAVMGKIFVPIGAKRRAALGKLLGVGAKNALGGLYKYSGAKALHSARKAGQMQTSIDAARIAAKGDDAKLAIIAKRQEALDNLKEYENIIRQASNWARYEGTDGKKMMFENMELGRFSLDPKNSKVRVTNVSVERPTIVNGSMARFDQPLYEANPQRILKSTEGQNVKIKVREVDPDDGDIFFHDFEGEVVIKDGRYQLKAPNKYAHGMSSQHTYTDLSKFDVVDIQRPYGKANWTKGQAHPREIAEKFTQGAPVELSYQKKTFGRGEGTETALSGEYVGILTGDNTVAIRLANGEMKYIPMDDLNNIKTASDGVIQEFTGGVLRGGS